MRIYVIIVINMYIPIELKSTFESSFIGVIGLKIFDGFSLRSTSTLWFRVSMAFLIKVSKMVEIFVADKMVRWLESGYFSLFANNLSSFPASDVEPGNLRFVDCSLVAAAMESILYWTDTTQLVAERTSNSFFLHFLFSIVAIIVVDNVNTANVANIVVVFLLLDEE